MLFIFVSIIGLFKLHEWNQSTIQCTFYHMFHEKKLKRNASSSIFLCHIWTSDCFWIYFNSVIFHVFHVLLLNEWISFFLSKRIFYKHSLSSIAQWYCKQTSLARTKVFQIWLLWSWKKSSSRSLSWFWICISLITF
jgi:hypothetical protein